MVDRNGIYDHNISCLKLGKKASFLFPVSMQKRYFFYLRLRRIQYKQITTTTLSSVAFLKTDIEKSSSTFLIFYLKFYDLVVVTVFFLF